MLSNHKNSYIILRPPRYYVVYQQNLIHEETAAQGDEVTGPSSHGQEEAGLGFKAMFIVTLPQQWVHWQKTNPTSPQMKIKQSVLSAIRGVGRVGLTPRTRLCNSHEQNINVYLLWCLGNCTI